MLKATKENIILSLKDDNRLAFYRKILLIAGALYLSWWYILDIYLPDSYNPITGRIFVSLTLWTICLSSYFFTFVKRHISIFFNLCAYIGTLHLYYLFYKNSVNEIWIVGCYLAVIAVTTTMQTLQSLLGYIFFVLLLSIYINQSISHLSETLFLPGIITILAFSYFNLKSKITLIEQVSHKAIQFRRILDATFDGMILHDGEFIIDTNDAVTDIFGYSRDELIGKSIFQLITLDSRKLAQSNIADQYENAYEAQGLKKDGTIFPLEIRAKKYLLDNGRMGRIAALQDLTERKKIEQTKILFEASQKALRIRNEFISMASHELKTPLTTIKLQTQIIQNLAAKDDSLAFSKEKIDKFIQQIDRQSNRLHKLIENMLDISLISNGKLSIEKQSTDLDQLIVDTIESLKEMAKQHGSEITFQSDGCSDAFVDSFRLEQVLTNLMSNAIKYGSSKPIHIQLKRNESSIDISVIDHGIGIADQDQLRIFDRFERAVASQNISGLGLGLYISQQIIQAHGGQISVKSKPHDGACFTIHLPSE